jgi:MoxR-like ATPase
MLADMVDVPDDVLNTLVKIRTELRTEGIRPSDRRFRQSLSIIKAKAALDSRSVVQVKDLAILKDGLWETVDQKDRVVDIVNQYAADKCGMDLERIIKTSTEVYNSVQNDPTSENGMEATSKFKVMIKELKSLETQYPERSDEIEIVQKKIMSAQSNISDLLLGV